MFQQTFLHFYVTSNKENFVNGKSNTSKKTLLVIKINMLQLDETVSSHSFGLLFERKY